MKKIIFQMKKLLSYFLGGMCIFCITSACHDDDDDNGTQIPEETLATNKWIHDDMSDIYFWNTQLPQLDYRKESDSEEYFYKLIYKDDPWSWITDDYASLAADYDGVPVTMGYDPAFYMFSNVDDQVFIVVNYVYPESPAALAGLKRGDIILKINNTEMNTDNYYDLYSGSSYSVQLGKATATSTGVTIGDSGKSLSMTARVTQTDPAIWSEVIDTLDHKIGYLAYVEFVAGEDSLFLETLDEIFAGFKSEGISDLIVDLRYNPGGESTAAIHLASEIAPAAVVNSDSKYLVSLNYNDDLQSYLESNPQFDDNLYYRFSKLNTNLNLNKVYFLTTDGTASASELVITGLDPYMEVVQIGDSTYGKFAGAWIWPDNEDEEKAEWAMIPIVMKYANFEGYTDFKDGLLPDILMGDDVLFAVPFGDTADPMIKRAIENIAGVPQSVATRSRFDSGNRFKKIRPENSAMNLRRNLYHRMSPELKKLLIKE